MFSNFYNTTTTELNAAVIIVNLLVTLVLTVFIVWIYRRTHRGLSYSTSLVFTLLMIALLGTMVMMVVQQNIVGAFALLGAFALIRFRTIVKDTRDVAFVFYALVTGVAVGTGAYATAVIAVVFIGAVIVLATRYHTGIGGPPLKNFVLTFEESSDGSGSEAGADSYRTLLEGLCGDFRLLSVKGYDRLKEYSYLLYIKDERNSERIVAELQKRDGVKNVALISAQEAWER
jgi:uncharacterized membrane protein YhiD involved in acid resistance